MHTYTLTEKEGTEGGVTYDKTSHEVKVEVTDNGQGKLVAAVTGNNPTFTNTYKAAETKATITTKKVLEGKALEADKYEFELKEGTKVVGTAKNKADGTVTFEDITYTEVGEHEYTVTEKAGNEAGVTYDSKSYTVKVKVTDNGQGQLEAKVTGDGDNVTFINKYNKPATETPDKPNDSEPKKELPNTGATDSPVLPGLLGFALMAVSAFLYRAKNNN